MLLVLCMYSEIDQIFFTKRSKDGSGVMTLQSAAQDHDKVRA